MLKISIIRLHVSTYDRKNHEHYFHSDREKLDTPLINSKSNTPV